MATKKSESQVNRSSGVSSPSTGKSVRVWGEAGITLAVTDNPPQFVRVTFGHERIAPDSTVETLKRYEKMINDLNEEIVAARAKKLQRLIRRVNNSD